MTKLSLNFKFIIAITFVISQSFISCNGDDIVDIGGLLEEETIEEIIDEQVEEEVEEIEETEEEEIVVEEIEEEEETEEEEEVVNGVSLPVTIDLTDLGIQDNGTSFSVDGFNFTSEDVSTSSGSGSFSFGGTDVEVDPTTKGLLLEPGTVTLDLSDINNISTISADITDNNSFVFIRTFNNGNLVEEVSFSSRSNNETISIDVEGIEIDAVSIRGSESELFSITLE